MLDIISASIQTCRDEMDYSRIAKPFPSYKWKWGAQTLTESLNVPEIYFGCLNVLYQNQGLPANSQEVEDALQVVQEDLNELREGTRPLNLARGRERNLFRNSGQYWKLTGLLESTSPEIVLTELGKGYASGQITRSEFASYVVKNFELPNVNTQTSTEVSSWVARGLNFKPLEIILSVILSLYRHSRSSGYITTEELLHVVIPMTGNKFNVEEITNGVQSYRQNKSQFSGSWVATDGENDHRIAREFLLFLHFYDFLGRRPTQDTGVRETNSNQEFFIYEEQAVEIESLIDLDISAPLVATNDNTTEIEKAIFIDESTQVIDAARERKFVEVLSRPNQAKFRKQVLEAGNFTCVLSKTKVKEALQACHIIPVKSKGTDVVSNGIVLRADLHTLFDKGHIRIFADGSVRLSAYLARDGYYKNSIPTKIEIPSYVSIEAINMRNEYSM